MAEHFTEPVVIDNLDIVVGNGWGSSPETAWTGTFYVTYEFSAIPEPASVLGLAAVVLIGSLVRRRRS